MSSQSYRVYGQAIAQGSEPELVARGLSYQTARETAEGIIRAFRSRFSCEFELSEESGRFEALRRLGPDEWGFRAFLEPEEPERNEVYIPSLMLEEPGIRPNPGLLWLRPRPAPRSRLGQSPRFGI